MYVIFRKSCKSILLAKSVLVTALFVLLIAAGALPTPASAQSATTGGIAGTVTDVNGALLPGTTVTVKSGDSGAVRTVKANASGEFSVDGLEPGTYTANFTADGFESYEENSILITVGSLANVSPKLKVGSVSEKIEVTDETPLMHSEDNAISTTVDQNAIDNLPINGRRFSDFALLTPGVVVGNQFGLLSFRGISFLLNNSTVDGADDNQAYFSEARGRTVSSYSISQAAIQEFQVNTSNYSAQYGRSAGGVINTVTKSGGNRLHGELFFYDRDNSLGGATNPYTLLSVPGANGTFNEVPYKPVDRRLQFGFGVGGPLIHDKLFWFYSYDQETRNFPGTAAPSDPADTFAPSNATLPAGETCSPTNFTYTSLSLSTEGDYSACAIAAAFKMPFQAGSTYYQQGLSIINSFFGAVPRRQDQAINLPKLDWQINDRNRLSVVYNRMRMSSPNGFQTNAVVNDGIASFGSDFVKEDFGIARLTTVLSNSVSNEALVQYGRDFEYANADAPSPNEVPLSHNIYGTPAQISPGFNFGEGFSIGKSPDLNRAALPDERRIQLLDAVTWTHGKHVSKAGLEYNRVTDYTNNLFDGNGEYSYNFSYDFIQDYLNATTGLGGPVATATTPGYNQLYFSYEQEFGNPIIELATQEYAGYATDDWRLTPTLTLTLGMRYEYEYVPANPTPNLGNPAITSATGDVTALPQTLNRPDDRNNIQPRLGFAWNVFRDNKTILRGGYGMYFGRIINSNIMQTDIDSGAPNGQIGLEVEPGEGTAGALLGCQPTFPNLYPSAYASTIQCLSTLPNSPTVTGATVAFLNPHMQNPQVHEADLALEQNMGRNTTFSVSYLMSLGRELPSAFDTNYDPADSFLTNFTVAATPTSVIGSSGSDPINTLQSPTLAEYPLPPAGSGYVVLPHGGKKLPLGTGQTVSNVKIFLQPAAGSGVIFNSRPDPAYGKILEISSDVNSSYNALAIQVNHRYEHGLSVMANFVWAHSLDENPYESTGVPTYTAFDPTNRRADYGNSTTDIKQRFVGAMVYQPQTHFRGLEDLLIGGWRIAPVVQLQTGDAYSPAVSGSVGAISVPDGVDSCMQAAGCSASPAYSGVTGDGSTADRLPGDRNQFFMPKQAVFDLRLGKNFNLHLPYLESTRLEFFTELFNVFNHQNITGVETNAYQLSGTTLTPVVSSTPFGSYTSSNGNTNFTPRQLQLAARLHF